MRRRLLRTAIIAILLLPLFAVARLASGVGASEFSSFDIASKATSSQWTFNSPSLGIPAEPTGELNFAFSESKLESGPSGYGLGSILWPGQVAAALPAFLQSEFERQCACDFPTEVPNYPVRAESFHPQGPPRSATSAGTMQMRSSATQSAAEGVAHANAFGFPGIGELGNQSSFSSSGFDPQGAVSMAEAAANDVSLLGGLITFDSVVTRATARSDGERGTVAGVTTITGAEVAGNGVVVDTKGVHVGDGQGLDSMAAQQAVNSVLVNAGISIELSAPVDTVQGAKATRSLGGVIVRMKAATIEPLIAALPDELENRIRGQITFDQEMTIQLAPAAVTAGAAKTIPFEPAPLPPVVQGTDEGSDAPASETTEDTSGGETTTTSETTDVPSIAGVPVAATRVGTFSGGVPVWLFIVLVLAAFVASRPLTAVADSVFAARGSAACPDESS